MTASSRSGWCCQRLRNRTSADLHAATLRLARVMPPHPARGRNLGMGGQELQLFVVRLGAALSAVGEPVYAIQDSVKRVAAAYGVPAARITAFPTSLLVSLSGESTVLELSTPTVGPARLDRIAALH